MLKEPPLPAHLWETQVGGDLTPSCSCPLFWKSLLYYTSCHVLFLPSDLSSQPPLQDQFPLQ